MGYKRKQEEKRRNQKLFLDSCNGGYPNPIWPNDNPNKSNYLKRYWKSKGKNSCWAWNKKYSHRYVRRKYKNSKEKISHNKCFDLWWIVW